MDMRERRHPSNADHWSDEKIGGRAYFNFDKKSLIIDNVKESDEGFYKCRMDFKQTPTKNSEFKLVVVGKLDGYYIICVPMLKSRSN